MMSDLKINTSKKLTVSAMVMALYVVVMYCTQSFAFGAVQVRIATALYSLSYFFPFLVLPLGLANLVSNILGGMGAPDIIGGFFVGVITAFGSYTVRKFKLPFFFVAVPILLGPGLIVPIWLSAILNVPYTVLAFNLCIGQIAPAILGAAAVRVLETRRNTVGDII